MERKVDVAKEVAKRIGHDLSRMPGVRDKLLENSIEDIPLFADVAGLETRIKLAFPDAVIKRQTESGILAFIPRKKEEK